MRIFLLLIFSISIFSNILSAQEDKKYHPYGVNCWIWELPKLNLMKCAHIYYCRIMTPWWCIEPEDDKFVWDEGGDRAADFQFHIVNIKSANHVAKKKLKVSLVFYGSPSWARKEPKKVLSYDPQKYADFIIEVLKYCDRIAPGIVEAVEITNEEPTGEWVDDIPVTKGTDQRDASWYYAEILKKAYITVKNYNKDILVVLDGIWAGAYHHLEDLYQLGCKGYFDRINLHYYTGEDIGPNYVIRVEPWTICVDNYATVLGYIKSIADRYNDKSPIWVTEFGWRVDDNTKAKYLEYVLDISRKTGYVERVNYYEISSPEDPIALIRVNTAEKLADAKTNEEKEEFGWVGISYELLKGYYKFKEFAEKYPVWDKKEKIDYIPPAGTPATIINPGFENGKDGWKGDFEISRTVKYEGSSSGLINRTGTISTSVFKIEPQKLYEVSFWVKVEGKDQNSVIFIPSIDYLLTEDQVLKNETPNCWGIVDTRKYPGAWRKIIFPVVAPKGIKIAKLNFELRGEGIAYLDDVKMLPHDLTYLNK